MNRDIRIATSFYSHIKRKKLEKRLGAKAVLSLIDLWIYAAMNKPDGVLSGMSEEDIALAAQWDGDPQVFVSTLSELHFLEKEGETYLLHEWSIHNPYAALAEARAIRARKAAMARWNANAEQCSKHANSMLQACTEHAYSNATNDANALHNIQTFATDHNVLELENAEKCNTSEVAQNDQNVHSNGFEGHAQTSSEMLELASEADSANSMLPPCSTHANSMLQAAFSNALYYTNTRNIYKESTYVLSSAKAFAEASDIDIPLPITKQDQSIRVPQQEIIDLYHRVLDMCPKVRVWNRTNQQRLRARWLESEEYRSLEWWEGFFGYVRDSPFLTGKKTDFVATLEWLIRPTNFSKVLNGQYHRNGKNDNDYQEGFREWLKDYEQRQRKL